MKKICKFCDKEFERIVTAQKYCDKECYKEELREYNKKYYRENIEKRKEHYQEHKEEIKEDSKEYNQKNKEKIKEHRKTYLEENREKIKKSKKNYNKEHREENNIRQREYRKDPIRRLNDNISNSIYNSLNFKGLSKAGRHWEDLVGYTIQELKEHLENLFKEGMSWDNRSEWHLDHIIPLSFFEYTSTDDVEFRYCWSLDNLKPLWAFDNISKGNKLIIRKI